MNSLAALHSQQSASGSIDGISVKQAFKLQFSTSDDPRDNLPKK
jgi:hypothetical protein